MPRVSILKPLLLLSLALPASCLSAKPSASQQVIASSPTPVPRLISDTSYTECDDIPFGVRVEYSTKVSASADGVIRDVGAKVYIVENGKDVLLEPASTLIVDHFSTISHAGAACSSPSRNEMTLYIKGFAKSDDSEEEYLKIRISKDSVISYEVQKD